MDAFDFAFAGMVERTLREHGSITIVGPKREALQLFELSDLSRLADPHKTPPAGGSSSPIAADQRS